VTGVSSFAELAEVRSLIIWIHIRLRVYPLVMTNIAIEKGPYIVDLPIKNGDFP
jgi:hypothetical protein